MANRNEKRAAERAVIADPDELTSEELRKLLDAAQLEIEGLRASSAQLLQRDIAPDEIDADPDESPGGAAYDAGLRAGLLRAALICETRWAGQIGTLTAASIREAEEAIR